MARGKRLTLKGKKEREKASRRINRFRTQEKGFKLRKPSVRPGGILFTLLDGNIKMKRWPNTRGVERYEVNLWLKRHRLSVQSIVEGKVRETGRPLKLLDVGCGRGIFLAELAERLGNAVELHGITVSRPANRKTIERMEKSLLERDILTVSDAEHFRVLKLKADNFRKRVKENKLSIHTGLAETHSYGAKFDLVFSVQSLMYSSVPNQALENTLNHLNKGGEAYLDLNRGVRKGLREELEKQGVLVKRLAPGSYHFRKQADKTINLRKQY